ncbi:ScbR family autoregulator-binding transcription factor [Streptomyces atroolivaceus]|uniref:ScbR family autoregulator-binding transcription factor n=1 Tax=Streptomyces atroolivaceus TaxID=66869 RepID=UPI00202493E4|nr:ScbR family autoregulator-binding transcription factor [Streptomyces atroolivaceus]
MNLTKQDRAARTRQKLIEAAAIVFDRRGYEATTLSEIATAAGTTKGAIYFHFRNKDDLAQIILAEQQQTEELALRPQPVKLQELVDSGMVFAERLRTDPLVRASVRLSLDQQATGIDRGGVFRAWRDANLAILQEAQERGELRCHVDLLATAELFVGTFAGLQQMSQLLSDYDDLPDRVTVLLTHLMPSIAVPPVLGVLDMCAQRGAHLIAAAKPRGGGDSVVVEEPAAAQG